jgi:hypothetical protein
MASASFSVKLTVTNSAGTNYTIEVPLDSIASTDDGTTYGQTQQMIADFTARTVCSLLGPDAPPNVATTEVNYHPQIDYNAPPIDSRLLASCYVERADSCTLLSRSDMLVVAVRQTAASEKFWYKIRSFTPLRRVLNAYTAEIGRDGEKFWLESKGRAIGYDDTAEDVSAFTCSGHAVSVIDAKSLPFSFSERAKPGCTNLM